MGKGSLKDKNDRRDRILGLLRSDQAWTVGALCDELNISRRTMTRDIEELRASGVPIEAERGKGGGVRLVGRWGVDRLQLTNSEIISLLVALVISETLSPALVATHSKSIRQKIALSFPESQRRHIERLRKRILFGDQASPHVLADYREPNPRLMDKLSDSFFNSQKLHIRYRTEQNRTSDRIVEPHYLLLNWPIWYLLAWDELRDDIRMFRTDRISTAEPLNETFRARPKAAFLESIREYFKEV